jgi:hypothetical protein
MSVWECCNAGTMIARRLLAHRRMPPFRAGAGRGGKARPPYRPF